MPRITINGRELEYAKGQTILQAALDHDIEIPHYCYHPGLSIVANCRICLVEVWAPNPKNNNQLEPIPKLMPACQTACGEGQVVHLNSPKAIANQKAVMEYLLINHPVDCPVCDQAGECYLQDYSYQYGRGVARFAEEKIKQPKKDVGPHVLLYADRCIMCTRCVRFCREVTGTGELIVQGRAATEQIDIFPGVPLDNELSANVIDICPVGALLDKDFLFQQRVWYLSRAPSIDGLTASGDNTWIEHSKGVIYRIKPRTNLEVNRWWITDEVRYGWKHVHSAQRLTIPHVKSEEPFAGHEAPLAYEAAYNAVHDKLLGAHRIALMVSPMLSCEDAYLLATYVLAIDPHAILAVGPVPFAGHDKTFPGGFTMYAEKAPNARGVRRVLGKLHPSLLEFQPFIDALAGDPSVDALVLTGNYPSDWVTPALLGAVDSRPGRFVALIDTLRTRLAERADVVLPAATWAEKAGTFENALNRLQAFERAIQPIDFTKSESQIALDLMGIEASRHEGMKASSHCLAAFGPLGLTDDLPPQPRVHAAAAVRALMARSHGLAEMVSQVHLPPPQEQVQPDMELVEL